MNPLLNIEVLRHKRGGHEDLLFEIEGLVEKRTFDTYYFALAAEDKKVSLGSALALLLRSWKRKLSTMKFEDTLYLPIDFSDQATGCIKVEKEAMLVLSFGYSTREGYSIAVTEPGDFYDAVTDFHPLNTKTLRVAQGVFEKNIDAIATSLEY